MLRQHHSSNMLSTYVCGHTKIFTILKMWNRDRSEKYANKLEIKKVCKQVKDGAQ